jgi:hypothetical protein
MKTLMSSDFFIGGFEVLDVIAIARESKMKRFHAAMI